MANVEHETFACDEDMYKEDGLYGDTTPTDRASVAHAWTILKTLLGSIPFTRGRGPFVICDYGTADGGNAASLMTNCINWVQKTYGEDQQVHVIYEDRPTNDFNTLIRIAEGS
ncbi:hypothetical protein LSAT2_013152 [Lamellibrachia satsuma]|nr:hypothetical protein LSAT2_013152 [Lamellibrachia satsuma]